MSSTRTAHTTTGGHETSQSGTGPGIGSRRGRRATEQAVTVRFAAWGPQDATVRASSGGGRGGAAYVVVQVGTCLTYAYDQDAVTAHQAAWQDATQMNRHVRLPEGNPTRSDRQHDGADLAVVCNAAGTQPTSVTSSTRDNGRPFLAVTVGPVTVEVHTTSALHSHLTAWNRAATVTGLLPATHL